MKALAENWEKLGEKYRKQAFECDHRPEQQAVLYATSDALMVCASDLLRKLKEGKDV